MILDNNHSKFSVICVRFMYKYLALCYIFNPTSFVFFKDISCHYIRARIETFNVETYVSELKLMTAIPHQSLGFRKTTCHWCRINHYLVIL